MEKPFLEQLAEPQPFPGGGSAAAHVGALALALVEKVIRLEIRRTEKDTPTFAVWNSRLGRTTDISETFRFLIQEDGRAYTKMASLRAQKPEADVMMKAVKEATLVPVQIIHTAIQGMKLVSESARECRGYLVPDLQVSLELLWAAAKGAESIAAANVALLKSASRRAELHNAVTQSVQDARDHYVRIKIGAEKRAPLDIIDPSI